MKQFVPDYHILITIIEAVILETAKEAKLEIDRT